MSACDARARSFGGSGCELLLTLCLPTFLWRTNVYNCSPQTPLLPNQAIKALEALEAIEEIKAIKLIKA